MRWRLRGGPLALIVAVAAACGGVGGNGGPEAAILEVTRRWESALVAGEAAQAVGSIFTEDAIRLPAGEPAVRGRSAIRDALSGSAALSSARFDIEDLEIDGDHGYATGTYTVSVTGEDRLSGKFLEVWKRTPAGWRIHRVMWD